jgi:hypothetical protein
MVRAAGYVGDNFGLLGIWDTRLKHADDRSRAITLNAPKVNGFANNGRVLLEGVRPETIGEDNDAGGLGAVIFRADQAPEHGAQAHHLEIRPVDNAAIDFARLAEPDYGEWDGGEVAKLAESLDPRL